jgi:hypothetical protein
VLHGMLLMSAGGDRRPLTRVQLARHDSMATHGWHPDSSHDPFCSPFHRQGQITIHQWPLDTGSVQMQYVLVSLQRSACSKVRCVADLGSRPLSATHTAAHRRLALQCKKYYTRSLFKGDAME